VAVDRNVTNPELFCITFAVALQKVIKPDVKFYQIPRGAGSWSSENSRIRDQAEIIPVEPEQGNACAGKVVSFLLFPSSIAAFLSDQF